MIFTDFIFSCGLHSELTIHRHVTPHKRIKKPNKAEMATPRKPSDHFGS